MTELFVNTEDKIEIGKITSGLIYGPEGDMPIAFKCIRVATKEEYVKFVTEQKLGHMIHRNIDTKKLYFYLVEILD